MGRAPEEVNALLRELEANEAGTFEKFVVQSSMPQHQVRLNQPFYLSRVRSHGGSIPEVRRRDGLSHHAGGREVATLHLEHRDVDQRCRRTARHGCELGGREGILPLAEQTSSDHVRLADRGAMGIRVPCRQRGIWSFGDDTIHLAEHAVCEQDVAAGPAPVGSKRPNAFGLFDMHGNADEWCLDWHKTDFSARSPIDDPVCLESTVDPASGRVVRGGAWNRAAWWAQSASRAYDFPGLPIQPHGFRVAIVGDLKATLVVKDPAHE